MIDMALKEDEKINENNIKEFNRYHMDGKYQCVLCKTKVYADESYSNRGDRLICHTCHWNVFKSVRDARNWMDRKDDADETIK